MTRPLVAAVLFGALAGAGHAQSQSVIRGRVVSAEAGDGLAHVRVVIYNDATPLPPLFTDGQGEFASPQLRPGRYRLVVRKAGYALTTVSPIDMSSGAPIDVRLPRAAAISGRIVDQFGEPSAGVMVSLLGYRPAPPQSANAATLQAQVRSNVEILNSALKRVMTDDQGEYRFGALAEGTYFIMATTPRAAAPVVEAASLGPVHTYFPGVSTSAEAQSIDVHPGDERTGIDIAGIETQATQFTQLSQIVPPSNVTGVGQDGKPTTPRPVIGNGVIRGTVTRIDGQPIAHATVSTRAPQTMAGNTFLGGRAVHTDEYGHYEFSDLPAGRYRITAGKLGFTSTVYGQRLEETTSIRNQPPGTQIDLAQGQTKTGIDITMPRYSAVSGRLLDDYGDPVEGIAVDIAEIQYQAGRRRLVGVAGIDARATDDLGRFRLYGLLPGQYIVSASPALVAPNQIPSDLSGYAPSYFPGTSDAREAQLVPVPRAQDVNAIDFALVPTPTATISGMKIGSDGEPMGGSLMLMESQRSGAIITPPAGARIKDDGRFEFPNVAPGEYVIQADRGRFNGNAEGDFASQYVTVNGGSVPDVNLRSTPGSTIRGHVVFDGDGPPPPLRQLAIVPERADLDRTPNQGSIARADVRDDLSFEITGVHGPRRIGTTDRVVNGWGLKAVVANGVDVTDTPIAFGSTDQSLSDVQVILTNRVTAIFATAADSRGATRDYTLIVFPDDRERWYAGSRYFRRARPTPQGYVTVEGLPPGEYHVAALANGGILKDGFDAWEDPDFLESIVSSTMIATLTEGSKASVSLKVLTR